METEPADRWRTALPRVGLALLLAAGIAWLWLHRSYASPTAIQHLLLDWGIWAPLIFMLLNGATTVFFLPGWIFGLAAGVLFGPWWGGLWSLLGATFGATPAFLAARYLASDWVAHHSRGWLKRLVAGVETGGWRFVALVRMVPLFPFNLSNYGFGLARIEVAPYVLATLIFQIPGTFAYAYLGYAGRELASGDRHAIQLMLYAIGGLAILVVLPSLIHRWRRSGTEWFLSFFFCGLMWRRSRGCSSSFSMFISRCGCGFNLAHAFDRAEEQSRLSPQRIEKDRGDAAGHRDHRPHRLDFVAPREAVSSSSSERVDTVSYFE